MARATDWRRYPKDAQSIYQPMVTRAAGHTDKVAIVLTERLDGPKFLHIYLSEDEARQLAQDLTQLIG